jgi:serine/threonine protein kinase
MLCPSCSTSLANDARFCPACGTALTVSARQASDDPIREHLSGAVSASYDVAERVGAGGMGSVYEARDRRHGRRVAIKIIHPELAASVGAARFLREIQIAARLQHPHVLPLFDSGEANGLLYYVTPFVAGESLRQRLAREKQLPLLDVCRITRQVASALTYAHREGVVHRDVKPDNILIVEGEAVVADFGIAKAAAVWGENDVSSSGMAVGTPLYMSPEQATGEQDIDGRADQYSLACVVFEMLTGQPPFTGGNAQTIVSRHVTHAPPSVTPMRPSVTTTADAVIQRGLAKIPADRFETALDFAEALDAAMAGTRTPGAVPGATRPPAIRACGPARQQDLQPLGAGERLRLVPAHQSPDESREAAGVSHPRRGG